MGFNIVETLIALYKRKGYNYRWLANKIQALPSDHVVEKILPNYGSIHKTTATEILHLKQE